MSISKETVEYVAALARLNFTDEEKDKLAENLSSVLGHVDMLNSLDTEGIEPTAHILPLKNVLREDERTVSYDRDLILKNAPIKEDGCFKVPKIVE